MSRDATQRTKVVEILEATTGGTRRHLFDLVTHIDRDRFDVAVICSTLRDADFLEDIDTMRTLGIDVIDIPMRREISPLHDIVALLRIWRCLASRKPDAVHTHSSKAGFLGRIAAHLARVKFVVHSPHVFSFEMDFSKLKCAFFYRLEKFAARLTNHMICVSPSERDVALTYDLAKPENCTVVTNGIQMPDAKGCERNRDQKRTQLGLADDDIVIGSVGRFTRQKGITHFLSVAKQLIETLPSAKFVLVGNGELRGEIERLIRQYGIANRCIAVNTHDDFSAYYPLFDIFVLTSLWEGMPYAMLEAMSAGRAVAAFRTGGIADVIIHDQNGILVPQGDDEALAESISNLATDPEKRDYLGTAARQLIASHYTLEAMVKSIEDIYMQGAST